jgi:radical SAM protein (TIGR01212 family)
MKPSLSPALPFRSLNSFLIAQCGERVQKITLDAGLTCPNRDGRVGWGGCIYCNSRGSGTGAHAQGYSLTRQLEEGIARVGKRYRARKFMAYFQSFSNTYAPVEELRLLYEEVLAHPQVVGLSIGTRPDCLSPELINLLSSYSRTHIIWLELGLQSAHDRTLRLINRGHDAACFAQAASMISGSGLHLLAHVILGLPQESGEDMRATARFLNRLPIDGVKIHLLYVIKDTPLSRLFADGLYTPLSQEEYINLVVDFIELLPPHLVMHRLTSDPHPQELIAPQWCLDKTAVLNEIKETFSRRRTFQGRLWDPDQPCETTC